MNNLMFNFIRLPLYSIVKRKLIILSSIGQKRKHLLFMVNRDASVTSNLYFLNS